MNEIECPKHCGEVVSGSDEKSILETMARHMAKFHPEPKVVAKPTVAHQPKPVKKAVKK